MIKILQITFIGLMSFGLMTSCETTELDLQDDPNALTQASASPDFILNGIQLQFNGQQINLTLNTMARVRMVNQFGTYANASAPDRMNPAWFNLYSIMSNTDLLEDISTTENLPNHVGVAQVLEAYAAINMVDFVDKIVYSEAVNPSEFPEPGTDNGSDVYADANALLDGAIINLSATPSVPVTQDLYFNGDMSKWIALANSLKLRMAVNTGDTALANSAIAANHIDSAAEDFEFNYSTDISNGDSRHPFFTVNYLSGALTFMSNSYMSLLSAGGSGADPRLEYYFYRQTLLDPTDPSFGNPGILDCVVSGNSNVPPNECYIGNGYWGRLHGSTAGVPLNNGFRTVYGAYPGGGKYDDGSGASVSQSDGLMGAGLNPILQSSFVAFLKAEASLPAPAGLGANGSTIALLEEGVRASMAKVTSFTNGSTTPAEQAEIDTYISNLLIEYGNATDDAARLAIINREYYKASFGNGVEIFNAYRRNGNIGPLGYTFPGVGPFTRSFFLPDSELNANTNASLVQRTLIDPVFWDTNPNNLNSDN